MKYTVIFALTLIAVVCAAPAPDPEFDKLVADLTQRIDTLEKQTEADVKHFEETKLKDSSELKELKGSISDLEQFKVDMKKATTVEGLEPVVRNLGYLEKWEPAWVQHMEHLIPPQ